ncbi:hypothetical protein MKW98_006430 [Papaver atlanticum]|uniref:Uncharacterized protein n=1 Tax=Papaver atlanticum TaxID=357466 RepID=A0AAD4X355_9MAGN|nr:hypothetical protein MKW98_006430 [Papaver atlanticum]
MGVDEENKKKIALDAIEIIQDKLEEARGQEYRECIAVERKFEKKAWEEHQVVIEQKCNQDMRPLYLERNEIFKAIPNFWLLAFLSHYALGDIFREEDQKNFSDNPYFTNTSLTKRISFCKDGTTKLSAVKIDWKDQLDIATEYGHETHVFNTSFFTWFCAPQVLIKGYHDEVSELIKNELWPNALEYFINGNESDDDQDEQRKRQRGMTQPASV